MEFLNCIIYLLIMSILIYIIGRVFPRRWIKENKFSFKARKYEKQGTIYEKLGIRKWKTKVPDASLIMHKIFKLIPKKRIDESPNKKIPVLIKESCVAEGTHAVAFVLGFNCVLIWNKIGGVIIAVVYGIAQIPPILIQRYNRPRYVRCMLKMA